MAFLRFENKGCLSYLLGDDETMECAVIDPHLDPGPYLQAARDLGMNLKLAVDTHSHADHRSGADELRRAAGAQVVMGRLFGDQRKASSGKGKDLGIADDLEFNAAIGVDQVVGEGDLLELGEVKLLVQETPGHTMDAISLFGGGRAFTGDALMVGQVGRTDLPGGDVNALHSTVRKLGSLSDELLLYPAHDYAGNVNSSLGYEKRHNPFLLASSPEEIRRLVAAQSPAPKEAGGKLQCGVQQQTTPAKPSGAEAAAGGSLRDTMCVAMEAMFQKIPKDWNVVSARALHDAINSANPPLLVDVRTMQEFAHGQVEGAVNIHVRDLPQRMKELPSDRSSPIVVMCQSGNRSAYAAMYLRAVGYTDVKSLDYGMTGWEAEGLPVVMPEAAEAPPARGAAAKATGKGVDKAGKPEKAGRSKRR